MLLVSRKRLTKERKSYLYGSHVSERLSLELKDYRAKEGIFRLAGKGGTLNETKGFDQRKKISQEQESSGTE